jgi:hypothetical protein
MVKERDSANLDVEIESIRDLIDRPVRSKEDRLALEAELMPVLTRASNKAVISLRNEPGGGGKYISKEVERRIADGEAFAPIDLLKMAEPLGMFGVTGNSNTKLFNLAARGLELSAQVASRQEVAKAVIEYCGTQIGGKTTLLSHMVSFRDDTELLRGEIDAEVVEQELTWMTSRINSLFQIAEVARDKREKASG